MQVRVFTKKKGHKPDFSDPVVLSADRGGTAVEHLCDQLHKSLAKEFKYALVWGTSTKHSPQRCLPRPLSAPMRMHLPAPCSAAHTCVLASSRVRTSSTASPFVFGQTARILLVILCGP